MLLDEQTLIRTVICAVVPNLIFMCTIGRNKDVHELISKLTRGADIRLFITHS